MLPSVRLPPKIEHGGTNDEIMNPSTVAYLRVVESLNPFHSLSVGVPVLRFVEIMRTMDFKGTVYHATESSRTAMGLTREQPEVTEEAAVVYSDLSLYETLSLVRVQQLGGTLICVIGEVVSRGDVQMLYLLCGMYRNVRIQTLTVSHADEQRLVIATELLTRTRVVPPPYTFEMSNFFLTKLDELNSMHGQTRLELARAPHRDKTAAWAAMFLPENVR